MDMTEARAERELQSLAALVSDTNELLVLRGRTIEALLAQLILHELPVMQVERIFNSVRSQLACGFPQLEREIQVAAMVRDWFAQLRVIESQILSFRKDERAAVLPDCPDCHGTTVSPGSFSTACERCGGTGKVAV